VPDPVGEHSVNQRGYHILTPSNRRLFSEELDIVGSRYHRQQPVEHVGDRTVEQGLLDSEFNDIWVRYEGCRHS